jgi:hypothetical protein
MLEGEGRKSPLAPVGGVPGSPKKETKEGML